MSFHYWRNRGQARQQVHHAHQQLSRRDAGRARRRQRGAVQGHLRSPADGRDHVPVAGLLRARARRDLGSAHAAQVRAMEAALARHAHETCAVIVEPLVQCAGNMRMYDPVYLQLLREACDALRRAPHRRRDRRRLRPHRHAVRLRTGRHHARLHVPFQGPHRRLPAAVGRAHHTTRSTTPSTTTTRSSRPSCTRTATPAMRSAAQPRWPRSTSSRSEPVIERNRAAGAAHARGRRRAARIIRTWARSASTA